MKHIVAAFGSGLLFSVGLVLAGMTQPSKVVGFLDFFGDWDPSLAFVMGGAIMVYTPIYRLMLARNTPFFAARLMLPTNTVIDAKLIGGAALFGAGWGLGGFCPGPGLTSIGAASVEAVYFVGGMLLSMWAYRTFEHHKQNRVLAPVAFPAE